MGINADLFSSR